VGAKAGGEAKSGKKNKVADCKKKVSKHNSFLVIDGPNLNDAFSNIMCVCKKCAASSKEGKFFFHIMS